MKKILSWLDNNLLTVLAGFLLVFIPLYPKWPLFDILSGYNVRVRAEDFFVAFTCIVFAWQFIRRRIRIEWSPVSVGLISYLTFGFLSMLVAFFVIQTIPLQLEFVEKTFLHWFRRIEYFSLFFILFSSVKSLKTIRIFLILIFITLFATIIYGFGQKYLYWPAFSTMNREYAKGWWLYLSAHARVLSTFGGHYDFAAYLVITLSLSWSFFFGSSKKILKLVLLALIFGGLWMLILTASRSSFVAYLVGLSVVVFLWTFRKGLGWGISRLVVTVFLSVLLMLSFGDLSDRFLHILRISDRVSALQSILLKPFGTPPKNDAIFLQNNLAAVTSKSDVPPLPQNPADLNANQPTLYVPQKTASGSTVLVAANRTYSQNAVMFDLSTGIRLDATWPSAIKGFETDPILGKGYATLNQASKYDFTQGESTDNDYLRALGETGLLGFIAFFGTLLLMAGISFRALGGLKDPTLYSLTAGFVGVVLGLMANAVLVDIFEASKVAYAFWSVAGITMSALYLFRDKIKADWQPLRLRFSWTNFTSRLKRIITSDRFWVLLILVLAFSVRLYKLDTPLADWHSWRQADTSAVTRDFLASSQINWLYPTYEDISSIASGKDNPRGLRLVEFPIYNAATYFVKGLVPELSTESAGRITTNLSSVLGLLFLFLLTRRLVSRRVAYLTAITFALIPYNIYYGRTILPDPTEVALALGSLWFSLQYLEKGKLLSLLLFTLFGTAAFLVKPFAIFLLLPVGYFLLVNLKSQPRRVAALMICGVVMVLPFFLWRWWISHFPEGIPASDWLYNGNGIRFRGAFWYWLFADRIGRLILGYWGLILFGLGFIRKLDGKYRHFPLILLFSSFTYLAVFATGNVQHDYYQILIVPSLAIFVGLGLDLLFAGHNQMALSDNLMTKILILISFIFMLAFGWYFVKDYYNINHPEIVEAGSALWNIANGRHQKALVIAPYNGDTAFLYQTNLRGWPIIEGSIDKMIQMGADYYVSVDFDDTTNQLLAKAWPADKPKPPHTPDIWPYKLLAYTDKYTIIQLVPDKNLPGN